MIGTEGGQEKVRNYTEGNGKGTERIASEETTLKVLRITKWTETYMRIRKWTETYMRRTKWTDT